MSSAAPAEPTDKGKGKEKRTVSKLLSRVKTVLKRGDGSKRQSILGSSKPEKKAEQPAPAPAPKAEPKLEEGVVRVDRKQLFDERAKLLGERFGLQVKPSEWWSTEGTALRIERPIRMRVRRNCHECNATFGQAKECPNCQHVRCKQCTRHPAKRTEEEKQASRERKAAKAAELAANPIIQADWRHDDKPDFKLTKPAKTGGQDLVYRKPRQRVRRNCHECGALFVTGSKTCGGCGHIRCTDCPRDPAKKSKYPYGYPGDEFGPNSTPYHGCHECKTVFPGGAADGVACVSCKHLKCEKCVRLKPKRIEPQPDPEVLKSVMEKLSALKVG
ncbi:uncharacterized protein DNG_08703 [Cephalotrichum gorgonifer]|uniref:Uncharacterized protein n=1 Tax=Cephalotrichum gorgonifer TaxID=2041049 RepID=A0AAE8SYM0_9PEZI|nr:uncharacterized protein DNG_08703 [Cephalotrichum gorgonifer]